MLAGRTILVVEDEPLVGLDIADAIRDAGAHVVFSHNVRDALTKAATAEIAAAVLDINVAGEDCSLVCQQLADRGIPFLFHTGHTAIPALDRWPNALVVRKPSRPTEIPTVLAKIVDVRAS
jgi:DNA-binding response OmpR family regulator